MNGDVECGELMSIISVFENCMVLSSLSHFTVRFTGEFFWMQKLTLLLKPSGLRRLHIHSFPKALFNSIFSFLLDSFLVIPE